MRLAVWAAVAFCGLRLGAGEILFPRDGFTFLNVAAYTPGREAENAAEMAEYAERTGNDLVLYCLTLHPEGKPAWAKVEKAVESYRAFAKALEGTKVRPGILLQAIVGHWPRVDDEIEPWERTIDVDGNVVRFCIFDPRFRAYVRDVGVALAKERPALILGDDDIRAFSPQAECFCQRHTAEFNRRTGRKLTADGFRALIKNAKLDSPEHDAFTRLQFDTVNEICRAFREGVDSVDPAISSGVSIPGWVWSMAGVAETAKIMSGGGCRFARLPNGQYSESSVRNDLPGAVLFTQAMKAWYGDSVDALLDESDTYPHNLWSKSAVAMHAKLVGAAMSGVKGAKAWLVNSQKYGYPVSRHYTDVLAAHRGYYPAISRLENETRGIGVLVPCHRKFPINTAANLTYGADRYRPQDQGGWTDFVFGKFGVPFQATLDFTQDGVYAISGKSAVSRFSDDELRQLLSRKLLVDADAARALAARGFAEQLGTAVEEAEMKFTAERDETIGHDISYPSTFKPPRFTLQPGAAALSWLIRRAVAGATDYARVAPATVKFRNALGGTVVLTAYNMKMGVTHLYGVSRQRWLWHVLDELNGAPFDNVAVDPQNVMTLARRAADGAESVLVTNLNPDPLDALRVRRATRPKMVEVLENDGVWKVAGFVWEGGILTVPGAIPCYNERIVRCR